MTNDGPTARSVRAGRWSGLRSISSSQAALTAAWCVAIGGFALYLARLDSFKDAYGSIGTAIVLLMWLTLFSVLFSTTPSRLRISNRRTTISGRDRPAEPAPAAIRRDPAHARMLSVATTRSTLSDREADMLHWGFAFGVAWAQARADDPTATEHALNERALDAALEEFRAARGRPGPAPSGESSAAHPHAHAR